MPISIRRLGQLVARRPENRGAHTTATCRGCAGEIRTGTIKCPHCGIINPFTPRRRLVSNRPQRETAAAVASRNHNGVYTIHRNQDQSLSCNCPSFLQQKEVQNGTGFATCKHIRDHLGHDLPRLENPRKATEWQKAALAKLGVQNTVHLTNNQAYFLFGDLLDWQGLDYREYEAILQRHGRIELLPYLSFGIEFEGGVMGSSESLSRRMNEASLPCVVPGYSHALLADAEGRPQWKIVNDGSVHVQGFTPVEVVTPKLFGAKGIAAIHRFADVWREQGSSVNRSCGSHVHFDAYNWTLDDMVRLALVWAKIEVPVLWYLVSPSRRNGDFCKRVDGDYVSSLTGDGPDNMDRYHSLNLAAYRAHKTIEVRLHQGTTESKKIVPWAVFMAKLLNAVKNGLTHQEVEPTLEGVFSAIGISNDAAVPVIREAREYLTERYAHWKDDAGRNPSHMPHTVALSLARLEKRAMAGIEEARARMDRERIDQEVEREFRQRTGSQTAFGAMSVYALQRGRPSRRQNLTQVVTDINAVQWQVPSVNGGEGRFTVTRVGGDQLNPADTLSCNCPRGRGGNSCAHVMNVARHLNGEYENRLRTSIREEVTRRLRPSDPSPEGR
ncbi:MAG: amidoligase family protein [Nitrospinae bacterium]|nr:amidoligase family protein [Nitrospinota bacterium]